MVTRSTREAPVRRTASSAPTRRTGEKSPPPRRMSQRDNDERMAANSRVIRGDAAPSRRSAKADAPTPRARARASAEKPAHVSKFADVRPVREAFTRVALYDYIAENAGVDRKTARACVDALSQALVASVHARGPGKFVLPGVLRVMTRTKPAVKGGKTVKNPFKPGETMVTKDRPKRRVVRILPSKDLKTYATS